MSKSIPKRKRVRLQQLFTLDGNTKTFHPPQYQPLLDHHLKPFFYNHDRLEILKKNKLINRRYKVVDQKINKKFNNQQLMTRPSMFMTQSGCYKTVKAMSIHDSQLKEAKSLHHSDKQNVAIVLAGFEKPRQKKFRFTQHNYNSNAQKSISKQLFQVFLEQQKNKADKTKLKYCDF